MRLTVRDLGLVKKFIFTVKGSRGPVSIRVAGDTKDHAIERFNQLSDASHLPLISIKEVKKVTSRAGTYSVGGSAFGK